MDKPSRILYSLADIPLYPHLKLTPEKFPRLLATRNVTDDGAEYFGALLNRTAVRILIDFLNRVFRLRSCDIDIDGSFPIPCTQYFRNRCLAPCVAEICDTETYSERVEAVRLFLLNDRERLRSWLLERIASRSKQLEFEKAGVFRDILVSVEEYWERPRWNVWLDNAVDTYDLEVFGNDIFIFLITQRNRWVVGTKVFEFSNLPETEPSQAMHDVISQFYLFHAPREIRVSHDFTERLILSKMLSERFGRPIRISVIRNASHRITSARALARVRSQFNLERAKVPTSMKQVLGEVKDLFDLPNLPRRIEAFDVAHISGTGFVGANAVWIDGGFASHLSTFWICDQNSELNTLQESLERRLSSKHEDRPDLIVVDGGAAHLGAAAAAVDPNIALLGAVKPPKRHSEISYFLKLDGTRIKFVADSPAMSILKILRDEAHDLANYVHREMRDSRHFYEARGYSPLVVPTRLVDENGAADDLRPIVTTDKS